MNAESSFALNDSADDWLSVAGIHTIEADMDYGLDALAELDIEQLGTAADTLLDIAATQPDDERALVALKGVFDEVVARGEVTYAMRMAMTIGAMACLPGHEHLQQFGQLGYGNSTSDERHDHHDAGHHSELDEDDEDEDDED